MRATPALGRKKPRRPAKARTKRSSISEQPPRFDPVWILLWALLIVGLLVTAGIFIAAIQPSASVLGP